jgi:hypothetical protein
MSKIEEYTAKNPGDLFFWALLLGAAGATVIMVYAFHSVAQ